MIWLIAAAILAAAALAPADLLARTERARSRRQARLAMPAFVDALGAALAAGLSIQLALEQLAPTLPRPVDSACARAGAELRLGGSLDRALDRIESVVPAEDVVALRIVLGSFHRSGGPIRRRLARVAALLRGRLALEDEQAALSAQGRLSATVLLALAPLGALFFALLMPTYVESLLAPGPALLLAAIGLEALGAVWLARIVRPPAPGRDLAPLLDAVVVGLDAGLTFEQSLRALAERSRPVARLREVRRLLADLILGRGRREAFAAFAAAGPAEARVSGLIATATRIGAPLAELLVAQADALREADRREAEARARRLPVLMLFPLTFCVLPALLIVFLGPPLLSLLG